MKRKAFTLIELIIVIVVLGILATIAIVGYRAVIDRSNQASAENSARAFDRQLRTQASFGQTDSPQFQDPRQGQLVIDTLLQLDGAVNKDIPDSDIAPAALSSNSLRVLLYNPGITPNAAANWIRLCTHTGCVATSGSIGATAGKIPSGSTATTPAATKFCFAFRKGGQTVYLGTSDRANVAGVVSATLANACGSTFTTSATAGYTLLGGAVVTTDASF